MWALAHIPPRRARDPTAGFAQPIGAIATVPPTGVGGVRKHPSGRSVRRNLPYLVTHPKRRKSAFFTPARGGSTTPTDRSHYFRRTPTGARAAGRAMGAICWGGGGLRGYTDYVPTDHRPTPNGISFATRPHWGSPGAHEASAGGAVAASTHNKQLVASRVTEYPLPAIQIRATRDRRHGGL